MKLTEGGSPACGDRIVVMRIAMPYGQRLQSIELSSAVIMLDTRTG